jgi:L-2-hydroxyglutarate oxidase
VSEATYETAIIGGGIVGLATALALVRRGTGPLIVLEAEGRLAAHQTGHNSGVIHSGIYYRPGSLKALNCTRGREALYAFCQEHAVPYERCGKLIVATQESELPALDALAERGRVNGLEGVRRLDRAETRQFEPHVSAVAALHVPQTGIVDFAVVAQAYARVAAQQGAVLRTSAQLRQVRSRDGLFELSTSGGTVRARHLINCAGLQSDRVARMCGARPRLQIVPFRGEYYELVPARRSLVRHLIYPVPDPRFPFLGVHFTRRIGGQVEAGPNAVLAWSRHGYRRGNVSWRDAGSLLTSLGFWRMARRHWRMALAEYRRSWSKAHYVRALQLLVPEVTSDDLVPAGSGVRAQALDERGQLVDDFCIQSAERAVHVLNAPSPAATASLSIGEEVARTACAQFYGA